MRVRIVLILMSLHLRIPGVSTVLVAALVMAVLGACGSGSTSGPDAKGRLRVVAGFYPLDAAARRVGGDLVSVTDLTPAGAEPHDLELDPGDVDRIGSADVVLYLGGGFQPALERAAERAKGVTSVDLLPPSDADRTDPHVWLEPQGQAAIADRVADALAKARPADSAAFRERAAGYRSEMVALDGEFRAGLADCDRHTIVTAHDAWRRLAARYGLREEPITGLSPDAEPDPKRLAELADLVRRDGATTVFTERLVSPRVAETLAREAGVTTAVLDPIEGLTREELAHGATYASVMRANLATLRAGLGCR
jgi:zinc transport system substrate-binding protein